MMNGGAGMFSRPVTVTRNNAPTTQRAMRRMTRYRRVGRRGSGWTSGSSGPATSSRYSGLVYRFRSLLSGIEEGVEDAVELLWPFGLGGVSGAFDHRKPRSLDQRVCACSVCNRKQRVVGTPDELNRELQLVQPGRHVVLPAEHSFGRDQRADRSEIRIVIALSRVQLPEVVEVSVIHGSGEVGARARIPGGHAPNRLRRGPAQGAARHVHQGFANARDRDQAVRDRNVGTAQAERVNKHQLAHEARALQRQLQRDAAAQRRPDDGRRAQPALLHVALDESREVGDAVTRSRLLAAAEAWKVGRKDS